jgi:hypothetical protein
LILGGSVRCARCGNENSETNRFCGMCGATLLQGSTQNVAPPVARPAQATQPPAPVLPPDEREEPAITGPSFLGLNQRGLNQQDLNQQASNQPSARASRSGSSNRLSIDPNASSSSSSLDYLLDDEDAPRGSGAGKFVLILVALALAGGLGYLRWKNQSFGWLGTGSNKHSASTQNPDDGSSGPAEPTSQTGSNPSSAPGANPPSGAAPQTPSPTGNTASNAQQSPTTPPGTSSSIANPATPPAAIQLVPSQPALAQDSSTQPAVNQSDSTPPPTNQTAANQPSTRHTVAPSSTPPAAADNADDDDSNSDADASAKPAAAVKPAKPVDPVAEAQKYIYGRGVAQSCDRGLQILKPAADRANAKAMVEMGALYSAGLCTPRDLPTAYRWFAMALRKDPDNQSVQSDLEKLWGEMTQPERQLAMKLSQ